MHLDELKNLDFSDILTSLSIGIRYDLRLASLFAIPTLLIVITPTLRNFFLSLFKKIKRNYTFERSTGKLNQVALNFIIFIQVLLLGLASLVYLVDYFYFSYVKARISSSVFRFVQNKGISFQVVWQTYPVITLTILLAVFTFLIYFFFKRFVIKPYENYNVIKLPKKIITIQCICFFFVFAFTLYGNFKRYPLRWSQSFFSTNQFISYATANPILYFYSSLKFKKNTFSLDKVKSYYDMVADFLNIEEDKRDSEKLFFKRKITETPKKFENVNVVIILLESLASFKTGHFGNPLSPTPYLDKVIDESLLFEKFFTPTVATARSVFTSFTSLPDVSRVKTGSRNPLIVNQNVIANFLDGYEKFYFLGGSANWGNIRGIIQHNIDDIKMFEEGSYEAPVVDVWGISDLDLFKRANKELKALNGKPFFAFIQSAGFHRPYTIPEDKGDFEVLEESAEDIKNAGFISNKEYNSLRFQDYAFGKFIEMAKKEKYYENTIFIVYGDHGLPPEHAKHIPKWQKGTMIPNLHVPLVFHGPKFFKRGVNKNVVSEMDIMPTAVALTGKNYVNKSLGRNIFDPKYDQKRQKSFFYSFFPPFPIGIIDDQYYFQYSTLNKTYFLLKHRGNWQEAIDVTGTEVDILQKYLDLSKGLYETARYMHYHNKRES
jgi:phosphoglycerol transferase MdoB-like AlkP superfamily enzyme